jgi:hypothetical protein
MVRATGYVLSVAANRTAPDLEPWTLLPHRTQALRRRLACRRERLDRALTKGRLGKPWDSTDAMGRHDLSTGGQIIQGTLLTLFGTLLTRLAVIQGTLLTKLITGI